MTTEQRKAAVEKALDTYAFVLRLTGRDDTLSMEAALGSVDYFALVDVAEAALDVLKDVPDAIGLTPCDEDDMDRAQDMKAQIRYAEVALDALRAALAKVSYV